MLKKTKKTLALLVIAAWFVGVLPASANAACDALPTDKGQLKQTFTVATAGDDYTIWLRTLAPNDASNSIYVQIDDQCTVAVATPDPGFQWTSQLSGNAASRLTFPLAAGEHTLVLAGDKAGMGVDLVALVDNNVCMPQGDGGNCQASSIATIEDTPTENGTGQPASPSKGPNFWLVGSGIVLVAVTGFVIWRYIRFTRQSPFVSPEIGNLDNIVVGTGYAGGAAQPENKLLHFVQHHRILLLICGTLVVMALSVGIAATSAQSNIFEAENATLTNVKIVDNPDASGGKYVVFEAIPGATPAPGGSPDGSTPSSNSGGGGTGGGNNGGGGSGGSGDSGTPVACGTTPNIPGGPDPFGGCWPGTNNTGVPSGVALSNYTGPCTISTPNTVIDSKTINCDVRVNANNVTIRKSKVNGTIASNSSAYHFEVIDSEVDGTPGAPDQVTSIGAENFLVLRSEVTGGHRSVLCANDCEVRDSYLHGQEMPNGVDWHLSAIRLSQRSRVIHNSLACDKEGNGTGGACSANQTGYPDFEPTKDWLMEKNLLIGSNTVGYCSYGGATAGKNYSNDPSNATNIVFRDNVFQRGTSGKCGEYGPIAAFDDSRPGNQWIGNKWSDGVTVNP